MDKETLKVFYEIHQGLPREGPGDAESTAKAFKLLNALPQNPRILDIGCGPGMQTLDLASLTKGEIVAVDNHQPYLDELLKRASREDVADRVSAINADMSELEFDPESFDLIWSEGSAYIMGFENALKAWKPLLKRRGYLALTEISWLKSEHPEELQRFWAAEYPELDDAESNIKLIEKAGYKLVSHFALPESSWWTHYYSPLEQKLEVMREAYQDNKGALSVIEMHQQEIELYRKYSSYYGYVFYVMQS